MSAFNLRVSQKLPALIVALCVVSALACGMIAAHSLTKDGIYLATEKLIALRSSRAATLRLYLGTIEQDMSFLARHGYIRQALKDFMAAWKSLENLQTEHLHSLYIEKNPYPIGRKHEFDGADDRSTYNTAHKQHHPWIRHFLKTRGYYDFFLFAPNGDLVYTAFKERDFATNILTGPWKDTGLGKVFRAAHDNADPDVQAFADFEPYAPSNGDAASFLAQKVLNPDGSLAGILAFQMPISKIDEVMQARAGMGRSGETYIVGAEDLYMRNNSRFSDEPTILKTKVLPAAVAPVIGQNENRNGVHETLDYRGVPVFSAYESFNFKGTHWVILAEIEKSEVMEPVHNLLKRMATNMAAVILLISFLAVLASRRITVPIAQITARLKQLAEGHHDIDIPAHKRNDEIGKMEQAVEVFRDHVKAAEKHAQQQSAQYERQATLQKFEALAQMSGGMAHEINNALQPILGLSEIVKEGLHGQNPHLEECMDIIYKSADNARKIVGGVLAFGRKNSDQERNVIQAESAINEAIWFAQQLLPSTVGIIKCGMHHEVNDALTSGEEHGYRININRVRLIQIITNLFSNAAHAMNNKGRIFIDLRQEFVSDPHLLAGKLPPGKYVILSIRDEGHGMDEKTMASAFDPFFTTKKVGEGTGLGLSIVHGIIKEWNGNITVESTIGKGTTFRILLPHAEEKRQAPES